MKKLFVLILILAFTINACQQNTIKIDENKIIELDEKSAQLVEADNAFGLEIFQQIREKSDEENLMISPLSISLALAMAYNGADGSTKTEMEETLKLNGLSVDEINGSYQNLIAALQSLDEEVVFELANAIFYAHIFEVKPGFIETNQNFYDAEVNQLNFSSTLAVGTINNWVAQKTHDKIPEIIDHLSDDDRMVLLNAIYFNGTWTKEFNDQGTKIRNFTKNDDSVIEVPMMSKEDQLEYASNNLFSSVKLPYGNGQYNMLVFKPSGENNSQDIINELNPVNWENWLESFSVEEHVVVTMPRFKFAFEQSLNEALKALGMQKAFSPNLADFSKLSDEDVYISSVKHKSFIDVNETGTEAAAVTSITFTTTSVGTGEIQKIYFTVDKPFVFAITEKDTGAILFIGEVQNPEYEE